VRRLAWLDLARLAQQRQRFLRPAQAAEHARTLAQQCRVQRVVGRVHTRAVRCYRLREPLG
jgi:hypothetical protein